MAFGHCKKPVIMIEILKTYFTCVLLQLQTWTCGSLVVVAVEHVRKRAWNQLFLTQQTQLGKQRQLKDLPAMVLILKLFKLFLTETL